VYAFQVLNRRTSESAFVWFVYFVLKKSTRLSFYGVHVLQLSFFKIPDLDQPFLGSRDDL